MKYFTSDLHLGEDRIGINGKPNLFYRPFKSIKEQNSTIIKNLSIINPDDELYVIGDFIFDPDCFKLISRLPKCKKYLILGNYDMDLSIEYLDHFDEVKHEMDILVGGYNVYLNHYPMKCKEEMRKDSNIDFSLTGHIHSLWKVQEKMINVSTDAWHFRPVSEETILFCYNAMLKFYDKNVFINRV